MEFVKRLSTTVLSAAASLTVMGTVIAMIVTLISAAQEHGLVVEALAVPQALDARGYNGQIVASEIVDAMVKIRGASAGSGPPQHNNLSVVPPDVPIKIQLSEGGVSVSEAYGQLRSWLSDTKFISGEIVAGPDGVHLIMRSPPLKISCDAFDPRPPATADMRGLISYAATCIYKIVEPYRYARFVENNHDYQHAEELYGIVRETGARDERPWAIYSLAQLMTRLHQGSDDDMIVAYRNAIGELHDFSLARRVLASEEAGIGDDPAALADREDLRFLLRSGPTPDIDAATATQLRFELDAEIAEARGDYSGAIASINEAHKLAAHYDYLLSVALNRVRNLAALHNAAGLADALQQFVDLPDRPDLDVCGAMAVALDHPFPSGTCVNWIPHSWYAALAERALQSNDLATAAGILRNAEPQCYRCLIVKALTTERLGRRKDADRLLAAAAQRAPTLPFAFLASARVLLSRGSPSDLQKAQLELAAAANTAPRMAEPQALYAELWIKRGFYALAAQRLQAAIDRAPNWTALHERLADVLHRLKDFKSQRAEQAVAAKLARDDAHAVGILALVSREANAESQLCQGALVVPQCQPPSDDQKALSQYKSAASVFEDVVQAWPWSGRAYLMLAVARDRLGDAAGACKAFATAQTNYGRLLNSGQNNGLEVFEIRFALSDTSGLGKDFAKKCAAPT